ncbi:MAG TPA: serine hydrolase [Rhizomicrobium sp.]|nr:serine hydrolase [Rhizomicrobium sp.]
MTISARIGAGACTLALLAAIFPRTALASDWEQVGANNRPSWVFGHAERRLRLLPALPGIEKKLHAEADKYFGNRGPGMSVGLVLDTGLLYSQGFGFKLKTPKDTAKPDENTLFRWGSLSKVMTATALLSLIDDPRTKPAMSIGDAADKDRYIPELKFVCPTFNKSCDRGSTDLKLTLKELASHHSTLADVLNQPSSSFGDEPSKWDVAKQPFLTVKCGNVKCDDFTWMNSLEKSWVRFGADELQEYSGVGMELAGLVEQRVSGKPYPQFVRDHLFTPLGMTHSTMDPTKVSDSAQAQMWNLTLSKDKKSWTFSSTTPELSLPGDHEPMLLPAGGFLSSVHDMSFFMKMWLSDEVPDLDGHPLLSAASIKLGETPIPTKKTTFGKCGTTTDRNNNFYRECGVVPAGGPGFGVGWGVETNEPQIAHNGSLGIASSQTVLRVGTKMGATAVFSSDGGQTLSGDDTDFLDVVVRELLLQAGEDADKATNWEGKPLSIGVARVLYLSGKSLDSSDLDAFTPQFVSANKLNLGNIVSFLSDWRKRIGKCRSFRVRDVHDSSEITVLFSCEKMDFDAVLDVETSGKHRISWTDLNPPPPSHSSEVCKQACYSDEGLCMQQAHSGPERGACVHQMEFCKAHCGQ